MAYQTLSGYLMSNSFFFFFYMYIKYYGPLAIWVVFANGLDDRGSILGRVILDAALLNTQ